MKILIIGHSVEDHIASREQITIINPGGIFYSTAGMIYTKEKDDEIFLATAIEKNNYYLFEEVFSQTDLSLSKHVEKIPKVHLVVSEGQTRHEKYENITDKLSIDFSSLSQFDGVLINMITGFDISLEDILMIRKNYSGLIYIDMHSLCRGVGIGFNRPFRKIPNIDKWLSCVDIVQVNDLEIYTLSTLKDEMEIANEVMSYGVKYFLITKGEFGVIVYYKDENAIKNIFLPAIKIETKNKVGCGDVFGSVFFYSLLKFGELNRSLNLANTAAGLVASYSNIEKIKNLKKDVELRLIQK